MRRFELLTLGVLLLAIVGLVVLPGNGFNWLSAVAFLFLAAHFLLEDRWQMAPAYSLAGMSVLISFGLLFGPGLPVFWQIATAVLAILLWLLAAELTLLFVHEPRRGREAG
ncbi:MAG: hypothetical protein WAM60_08945 [Candidatus Promineifilaceae bacterium]